MGAWTCQYGTVHKMCRCPTRHTMACPTPAACAGEAYVPKHRADYALLGEDVSMHAMGPEFNHRDDLRLCVYHNRLRTWVTDDVPGIMGYVECLRTDHPTRTAPMAKRADAPRGTTRATAPPNFQRGSEGGCYS